MKAVVAAFNQEKALVGAFSVITNLRMELFGALISTDHWSPGAGRRRGRGGGCRRCRGSSHYRAGSGRLPTRSASLLCSQPQLVRGRAWCLQCFNEEPDSSVSGQEYNQLVTVTGDSGLVSLDICAVELSSDLIALLVVTSTRFQNLESIPCRFQNTCMSVDIG